jgi:hypothetical protein
MRSSWSFRFLGAGAVALLGCVASHDGRPAGPTRTAVSATNPDSSAHTQAGPPGLMVCDHPCRLDDAGQCHCPPPFTVCGTKVCGPHEFCCTDLPFLGGACLVSKKGVPDICPISRRAYKTDVAYLRPADVEQLRDELMRFKLATYRYRDEPAARAEHLGFMIDDVAPSASVTGRTGNTVDLYGYTSMAVAALQVQAGQIEALQREVKALRAAVRRR